MSWKIDAIVNSGMEGGEKWLPCRHFIDITVCFYRESKQIATCCRQVSSWWEFSLTRGDIIKQLSRLSYKSTDKWVLYNTFNRPECLPVFGFFRSSHHLAKIRNVWWLNSCQRQRTFNKSRSVLSTWDNIQLELNIFRFHVFRNNIFSKFLYVPQSLSNNYESFDQSTLILHPDW